MSAKHDRDDDDEGESSDESSAGVEFQFSVYPYWSSLREEMNDFRGSDEDFVKEFQPRVPVLENGSDETHQIDNDLVQQLLQAPPDASFAKLVAKSNTKTLEAAIQKIDQILINNPTGFLAKLKVGVRKVLPRRSPVYQYDLRKSFMVLAMVPAQKNALSEWVTGTVAASAVASSTLLVMAGLSTQTKVTFAQNTNMAKLEQKKRRRLDKKRNRQHLANPLMLRDKVVVRAAPLDEFGSSQTFARVHPEKKIEDNVQAVIDVYEALFRKAAVLRRQDDRRGNEEFFFDRMKKATSYLDKAASLIREKKMNDTTKAALLRDINAENNDSDLVAWVVYLQDLRSWLGNGKEGNPPSRAQVSGKYKKQTDPSSVQELNDVLNNEMPNLMWLPGPTAQEVRGSQVIFGALLRALADCLPAIVENKLTPAGDTPVKGNIQKEREVPRAATREARYADFTLSECGRYRRENADYNASELPVELKPPQRMVSTPAAVLTEGLNQGLAHAAKSVLPAMNLGQGFPAHSIFVVGTILHVQVYKLMLKDPGTPKCKVELEQGGLLPLLSSDYFDQYMGTDRRHPSEANAFRDDIYNPENLSNVTSNSGVRALVKLMESSNGSLNQLDHPGFKSAILGSGAFGVVLAIQKENEVLKLSCYGYGDELAREAGVLKYLQSKQGNQNSDGWDNVVSMSDYGLVQIPSGGVSVPLPGMVLSPRGVRPSIVDPTLHSKIAKDLGAGLGHLHECGLVHGDMSYSNFVLVGGNRAVIIDLATARPLNTRVKKMFIGTPDFVHDDIHKKKSWVTCANYDFAALAFTLCVLHNEGKTPWSPLSAPCDIFKLQERGEVARAKMNEALQKDLSMQQFYEELLDALTSQKLPHLHKGNKADSLIHGIEATKDISAALSLGSAV